MIELNNISFREYFELEDKEEYDFAMKYAFKFNESIDHFEVGDFFKLPFGIVKDLQYDLSQGVNWEQLFDYFEKLGIKDIVNEKLLTICQQRKYIISEIERINEIESLTLSHESTEEEESAGIDNFKDLGIYLQIRSLTKGDVTKNNEVRATKYEDCFLELVTQKRLIDYDRAMAKIIRDRHAH